MDDDGYDDDGDGLCAMVIGVVMVMDVLVARDSDGSGIGTLLLWYGDDEGDDDGDDDIGLMDSL